MRSRALAAAAAAAFVAIGAWQILRRPSSSVEPVPRGGPASSLSVKIEKTAHGILIVWTPHPAAGGYEVDVIRADGVSLLKRKVSEPSLAIDAGFLPRSAGEALYVRIQARGAMGQFLAQSPLQPLPAP
jgi:hypothetical protein